MRLRPSEVLPVELTLSGPRSDGCHSCVALLRTVAVSACDAREDDVRPEPWSSEGRFEASDDWRESGCETQVDGFGVSGDLGHGAI